MKDYNKYIIDNNFSRWTLGDYLRKNSDIPKDMKALCNRLRLPQLPNIIKYFEL